MRGYLLLRNPTSRASVCEITQSIFTALNGFDNLVLIDTASRNTEHALSEYARLKGLVLPVNIFHINPVGFRSKEFLAAAVDWLPEGYLALKEEKEKKLGVVGNLADARSRRDIVEEARARLPFLQTMERTLLLDMCVQTGLSFQVIINVFNKAGYYPDNLKTGVVSNSHNSRFRMDHIFCDYAWHDCNPYGDNDNHLKGYSTIMPIKNDNPEVKLHIWQREITWALEDAVASGYY